MKSDEVSLCGPLVSVVDSTIVYMTRHMVNADFLEYSNKRYAVLAGEKRVPGSQTMSCELLNFEILP